MSERHADPLAGYRWVDPPRDVANGAPPLDRRTSVPADSTELHATEVWTGDLQAVIALEDVPLPRDERDAVEVDITAVAPGSLGPLPRDAFADGNAYKVVLRDGDATIEAVEPAGRIILQVPHAATAVLHSADGSTWVAVESEATSPVEIEASFERTGFYLAVADHAVSGSDGGLPPAITAAALAAPIVLLVLLLLATRRWRASR